MTGLVAHRVSLARGTTIGSRPGGIATVETNMVKGRLDLGGQGIGIAEVGF